MAQKLGFAFAALFLLLANTARAESSYFLTPSIGAGYNTSQGSYIRAGLDLGMYIDENLYAGVGGYYGAGQRPEHDREIGGGPFVGYVVPLTSFLSAQLREDMDYVDVREPFVQSRNPDVYNHDNVYGIESSTYAGLQLAFTRNFGISAGYRVVVGLSNSSIASGRSGVSYGLTLGF